MIRILSAFWIFFASLSPIYAAENVVLRIHGSNTIGAKLAPALVIAWLKTKNYNNIQQNITAPEESLITAQDSEGHVYAIEIHAHGSSTSFQDLIAGTADIGIASRSIKSGEISMLKSLGKMDSPNNEYVLGLDGISVIVNAQNPLNSLDKSIISQIFSGAITDWSKLGLAMGEIHIYARDNKSGTFDTFKTLVFNNNETLVSTAKRFESNAKLSDSVTADPNGIGFVGLPYIRKSKAVAIADDGASAIQPNRFSVGIEDYALARRLYFYVPEKRNQITNEFVQFSTSAAGQEIVDKVGFVSQNIFTRNIPPLNTAPDEYKALTKGAQRLSMNLRFRSGKIDLDNKALRDVDRLVHFMFKPENRGKELMLFGFADSTESLPLRSIGISVYRADAVADYLIRHNLEPTKVRGYGQSLRVASNVTARGRQANRRVEVWIR